MHTGARGLLLALAALSFSCKGAPTEQASPVPDSGPASAPTRTAFPPPASPGAVASAASPPATDVATTCPDEMVFVHAGTFTMGAPDPKDDEDEADFLAHQDQERRSAVERPAHPMRLAGYCIDRTEVTVGAYAACVNAGHCKAPAAGAATEKREACNFGVAGRERYPVNCVTWDEANAYCSGTGARLPTEAEWEYAARGDDGRLQPWGAAPFNVGPARYLCLFGFGAVKHATCSAGAFPAGRSPFGVDDMLGNVEEWVGGYFCKYPRSDCISGDRVYRDTDFDGDALVRVTSRTKAPQSYASGGLGFRCAADPTH